MKIQCDVCNKKEASVFCTADEAALCDVCDQRVHHANKLASKHQRSSLLNPSSSHLPMCDICQEKRAILFCQEDRAILCRECDIPLHTANEHTQKHNRFLLTGIKLSDTKISKIKINDDSNAAVNNDGFDIVVPDFKSMKNPAFITSSEIPSSTTSSVTNNKSNSAVNAVNDQYISDYLIETLPGWHFDDFILDPTSTAPVEFSKMQSGIINGFEENENMLSFFDMGQHEKNLASYYSTDQADNNIWVPQAAATTGSCSDKSIIFETAESGKIHGPKLQETSFNAIKFSRKCRRDDAFTVPQIISSSFATNNSCNKRTRSYW